MSSPDLSCVPSSAALEVTPFEVEIGDGIGDELKVFLKHAKLPKDTFENRTEDGTFGVSKGWIEDTIEYWRDQFDWPKREQAINSFPHFKTLIKDDDGKVYDIHFVALFSAKPGALPIIFLHGWPGSFLEFLPILDLLRKKYAPESLPYNVIVLSLPGFTFSTLPDLDRGFTVKDAARTFDRLASGLGFKRYITQGGDIGSRVARIMGSTYPACREVNPSQLLIIHVSICSVRSRSVTSTTSWQPIIVRLSVNFSVLLQLDGYDVTNLSDKEKVRVGSNVEMTS